MTYRGFEIEEIKGEASTNHVNFYRVRGCNSERCWIYDIHTKEEAKKWIDNKLDK